MGKVDALKMKAKGDEMADLTGCNVVSLGHWLNQHKLVTTTILPETRFLLHSTHFLKSLVKNLNEGCHIISVKSLAK